MGTRKYICEKWLTDALSAAGGSAPASQLVADAIADRVASAATLQRVAADMVTKERRDGVSYWTLNARPIRPQPAKPAVPPSDVPLRYGRLVTRGQQNLPMGEATPAAAPPPRIQDRVSPAPDAESPSSGMEALGGYWMWMDSRLAAEIERRDIAVPFHGWTHAEMCACLDADDHGTVKPRRNSDIRPTSSRPF